MHRAREIRLRAERKAGELLAKRRRQKRLLEINTLDRSTGVAGPIRRLPSAISASRSSKHSALHNRARLLTLFLYGLSSF
jgi:hypothetical protein